MPTTNHIERAERRGFQMGMVIAAGMIADRDDNIAAEILEAVGLTSFAELRIAGCDDYDIKKLRHVLTAFGQRRRRDAHLRGFGFVDGQALAA